MPYDAPDYSEVLWENGKPYWKTASGKKTFIPPLVAAQMRDNPRAQQWAASQGTSITYGGTDDNPTVENVTNNSAPGGGLLHERGQWNSETGEWDQPINWSNIASLAVGGAIAAPFVVPALAGAGGASGTGGAASTLGTGAATTGTAAGTGGLLASTPIAAPALSAVGSGAAAGGSLAGGAATGGVLASTPLAAPSLAAVSAAGSSGTGAALGGSAAGTGAGLVSSQGIGGLGWGDIINAGLSYVQARQSANASQDAAAAQAAAVQAGIAEQRRQYDLSRGDFLGNQAYTRQQITGLAPYQQLGSTALGNLYSLTGHAAPAGLGAPGVAGMPPPQASAAPQGPPMTVAQLAASQPGRRDGVPPGATSTGEQAMMKLVTMEGPDGSRRGVPAGQVAAAEARGARRVS